MNCISFGLFCCSFFTFLLNRLNARAAAQFIFSVNVSHGNELINQEQNIYYYIC